MISEGQAEPWEAVTTPPNPPTQWMFSCPPDQLIATYNQCMTWAREASVTLDAYIFWGAEYWILRCANPRGRQSLPATLSPVASRRPESPNKPL